ncbi:MAG: 4Fe-4S dicluster domain-containing protein [Polyangiaceae bacterium]|nr:4Fe-4S dicluster domain-containing protein [Polyangiaceae bacterium]
MPAVPPRAPLRPPCVDANDARYWDERDLEQELLRAYHICADCRMCVTYCGSFPILFEAVDREVQAGRAHSVERVDPPTIAAVTDHCWQCKLCYIKCPYTPDEGAYEALDFPRLLAREKAVRARRDGIALVDRVLGEPEAIGAAGAGPQAPLVNFVNANRLARKAAELVTGVSAEMPLPPMARETFSAWWRARGGAPVEAVEAGTVVLFPTCYGEYNYPEVPRAAALVLERNGFEVVVPPGLRCCGMPNLDGGDVPAATEKMRASVEALLPHVRRGAKVIVPGPTCGYTMKKEWASYVGTGEAAQVAAATVDLMEWLEQLRRQKRLDKRFERSLGKVAYHASCHLRAQKIGIPGARLLGLVPETEVRVVERCSAIDGTWGLKAAYYEEGARYAARLVEELAASEATLLVGDCSLSGLRVQKSLGRPLVHPVQALAHAYGFDDVLGPGAAEAR